MKNKVLLYLLFALGSFAQNTHICYAQAKPRKISIVDQSTMEPIPYARVSFGYSNGVYSDLDGQLSLPVGFIDSIKVSHLYYESRVVLPKDISDNMIALTPVSYSLDEVTITKYTGTLY